MRLRMTSLWRLNVSASLKISNIFKIYTKYRQNWFSAKNKETCDFHRIFGKISMEIPLGFVTSCYVIVNVSIAWTKMKIYVRKRSFEIITFIYGPGPHGPRPLKFEKKSPNHSNISLDVFEMHTVPRSMFGICSSRELWFEICFWSMFDLEHSFRLIIHGPGACDAGP